MLEPNSWTEVKRLFNEALPLDPTDRARYLDDKCGSDRKFRAEIESLLTQNDQAGNFMRKPLVGAESNPVPDLLNVETLVKGRYRVERKLSQGGFGAVFLARDENLHERKVVIKVLLPVGSRDATWIASKLLHIQR